MENNLFLQMLNEAYYGKTQDILKIEEKIGEIRKKYKSSQHKVNSSKEVKELEAMLCKEFGFADLQFTIQMVPLHNAMTIPISIADISQKRATLISTSNNGIRYKPEAKAYIVVSVTRGLFFSFEYTDGEIAALIMHEIGHNFQSVISNPITRTVRSINNIIRWCLVPFLILAVGPLRDKWMYLINQLRTKSPEVVNAFDGCSIFAVTIASLGIGIKQIFGNALMMLNPLAGFAKLPITILKSLKNNTNLLLPLSYRDEVIADEFSTAYGYGPELASALTKIKRNSGGAITTQIYRDSILGPYFDLCMIPEKLISNIFDAHPNTVARMRDQYDMLEKELLNGDLKPSMKAQIKKDMKEIKALLDAFTDFEEAGFFFSNAIDKVFLKFFKGDIRNIFAAGVTDDFDKIDKTYRDA